MKVRFDFASIDGKDYSPVFLSKEVQREPTKYNPDGVGYEDVYWYQLNKNNRLLQARFQREYLVRLRQLQLELSAKYQPLLDMTDTFNKSEEYGETVEEFEDFDKVARIEFPGDEADWYN
jgi:hypothetical protein